MGASVSMSSQLRRSSDNKQKQKLRHGKDPATALLVFMDDGGHAEEEELSCWKLVSKPTVDASEFPHYVLSDASVLFPGLPIFAQAAPLYRMRQGEIYYAVPVRRLGTVFTAADMLSLLQRSRAAMADSPSFAFAEQQQLSSAIIDHRDTADWDSEMRFLKTAANPNNKQQWPWPKVQGTGRRLLRGPPRLAPVPECHDCEYE